ncbi:DIL domain-containing protein [Ditylenchus destructor]|uniref:DIL domain-containing protein n=1 Tax=Ditylenchus destructor TaxID=166010 RepID=A0AAD4MNA5_9BILA|nr:DIL domain-containing protein [Ditylenchus destructor]
MDRINQTVNLLITPKTNDQIASLGATCYKLNSLQVRYLLESYITEEYEPRVGSELIDHVVYLASTQADMMAQQDGESVQLEESQHLMLPFLFPQDGYIVETLRGVPGELASYVTALQSKGLCRVIAQNDSNGFWNGHMSIEDSLAPSHNKSDSLMSSSSIGTASSRTGGEAPPKMARQYHLIDGIGDANYAIMNKTKSLNNGFGTEREQAQSVDNGSQRRWPEIIRVVIRRAPNEGIGLSIVAAQFQLYVFIPEFAILQKCYYMYTSVE